MLVKTTRPKRYFYAAGINMNYSFDTLSRMAQKMLGAELDVGDIIICDNADQTKRKMLQKTKTGFMIYYARLNGKQIFAQLAAHNGMLKTPVKDVL